MGGIALLVRKSLRQHALSTVVTACSVALASGLVMAVFAISAQTRAAFVGGDPGFDAVLGARGSQLQLVLNTVFHLETSPGNIPWSLYMQIKKDPRVDLAIPYALGDNYRGFRIVGTSEEIFTHFEVRKGEKFRLAQGGYFDGRRREAVLGSFAAAKTGLKPGDTFQPFHGLVFDEKQQHAEVYVVKGVLAPTNTPNDRVFWIPIEGIFRMGGHVLGQGTYEAKAGEEIPDEHKEVSAVMVRFKGGPGGGMAGYQLAQDINRRGTVATLAWPIAAVLGEFFDKLGWMTRVLELVAYLVVLVAMGAILASIYNTMNERRREFAILRALGARRTTVLSAIVAEAATISALGALLGFAVYAAALLGAGAAIRAQTGVVLDLFALHPVLLRAPLGMVLLGALSGLLPALKAYSTDVAGNLTPAT